MQRSITNYRPLIQIDRIKDVLLTRVRPEDWELIMAWRSHPDIYHYFQQQKSLLSWQEHSTFWKSRKHRLDYLIWIFECEHWRKVGTCNLSKLESDCPEIGILIGELSLHGKGVGSKSLSLLLHKLQHLKFKQVTASVHAQNEASMRLFTRAGFELQHSETSKDYQVMIKIL